MLLPCRLRSFFPPVWAVFAIGLAATLLGSAAVPAQETRPLQQEVRVVNIEVPVRVFDGAAFVKTLTLDDFEVRENGVLQKPEAVYLVRKSAVERKEERTTFAPQTKRNLFLFFQVHSYQPRIGEAINFFAQNVLRPDDGLTVVTAVKPYHLKPEWIAKSSKEEVARQLVGLVKRDTLNGNTEYRSIIDELKRMLTGGGVGTSGSRQPDLSLYGDGSWQEFLMNYRDLRERLETLRQFDDERLLAFADYLKKVEGQKNVLFFYQKEYMPVVDRKRYIGAFESGEDFLTEQDFKDLFDLYHRDVKIDTGRISRTFADASIAIHFLYLTAAAERDPGTGPSEMEEHSEDIFGPFLEMAKATGGVAESSANPASLMRTAGEASDNYYLLYYKPSQPGEGKAFREIKVTVKGKSYRVLHRAGYFAD